MARFNSTDDADNVLLTSRVYTPFDYTRRAAHSAPSKYIGISRRSQKFDKDLNVNLYFALEATGYRPLLWTQSRAEGLAALGEYPQEMKL